MSLQAHCQGGSSYVESDILLLKPENILGGFCGPVMGANPHSDFVSFY